MRNYFLILILTIFCCSCDSTRIFEENKTIENNIWSSEYLPNFQVEITDTSTVMNVFINIRHNAHYPFSNLWLFVKTIDSEGHLQLDTLECMLAAKDGKWLGSGLGNIWDIQIPLKKVVFKRSGEYEFQLEQAMRYGAKARIEELTDIMSVGLRIEKNE